MSGKIRAESQPFKIYIHNLDDKCVEGTKIGRQVSCEGDIRSVQREYSQSSERAKIWQIKYVVQKSKLSVLAEKLSNYYIF